MNVKDRDGFGKATLNVNGKDIHMSMPFAKVDKSARTVSGFATLDNIDTQGDVVLAEASVRAFSRARGNIREQHDPYKAVGRMVDFREEEFYHSDPETGEGRFYRGIFVTARVSEGAEDTWKKVLDGTLSGFSIGGEVVEASNEFVKEAGKTIKFIKDYELTELSLVDNPANQLANIVSIQKSKTGGTILKGMAVDTVLENVFICEHDDTVVVKDTDKADCPMCDAGMECVGWFESVGDRAEKVRSIVNKFRNHKEDTPISFDEGGVEMSKNNTESQEEVVETPEAVEETPETAEETEVSPEEVVIDEEEDEEPEVDEVVDEESEISKKIDALHEAVRKTMDDAKTETISKVSELEAKIEEVNESFMNKASELEAKIEEFGPKLEAQKSRLAEFESRLTKMNSADAVRKSAGITPSEKIVQKESFWDGAFSG